MKKFTIASILALAVTAASALEVGVSTTKDYAAQDARQAFGGFVSQNVGKVGVTAGFERFDNGPRQDRYSLVAGYPVAKIGLVTFTPKLGVAYLNNAAQVDGYAVTAGVGASVPVYKNVTLGVDYARQYGQERVNQFDGNKITTSLSYKF